jgi:hypothetical protein
MKPVPPIRLRDDPRAPRLLRADLARVSRLPAVTFDAARGLAALEAAIQAGAAPFASSAAAGKSLAAAVAKGALVGLVTVGIAGVSSLWLDRRDAAPPPRAAASVMPAAVEVTPPAPPALTAPPEEPSPPPPPRALAPPSPPVGSIARRPGLHAAEPSAAPEASAPPAPSGASQLQEEMANLARLRALDGADPQQALALAEEGQRRFPSGLYAQEREALAISALVRLGRRGEAEARARAFVAAYPRSSFVEKIRGLTGVGAKE